MVLCLVIIGQISISFTDFFVAQWYKHFRSKRKLKVRIIKIIKFIHRSIRVNWETELARSYQPTFIAEKSVELAIDANGTTIEAPIITTTMTTSLPITTLIANTTAASTTTAAAEAVAMLLTNTTLNETLSNDQIMDDINAVRHRYMYTYAIIILLVIYLVFQRSISFYNMCLKASRKIHDKLFRGIIRAPMHFYNANSSGRIMNRFSKDVSNIDTQLPLALYDSFMVKSINFNRVYFHLHF